MPIETFPIGPLETNCHIVISGSDAVAVDPGGDLNSGLGEVLALLKEQNLTLRAILCTHFHFDHLYGVAALHEATGAPVYGPAGDASLLGTELGGSGGIAFGDGGAQLLFDRLEFTGAHTVAEIGLLTGAQTLDGGFGVSHFSVLSTWF